MSAADMLPVASDSESRYATKLRASETGLEIKPDLTIDEWEEVGHAIGRANRASAWWIGDWINYGESKWGEKYDDAQRITDLAYDTLRRYAQVAACFPIRERFPKLSYAHHQIVAPIQAQDERRELLALAADLGWAREKLRAHVYKRPEAEGSIGVYFGKGDKWREATEPLKRYLAAFEKRGYEFGHVNPRDAKKRLDLIDHLIDSLSKARTDLEMRSHEARAFSL